MKAPNLPSLSERRPVPQVGHWRGSVPSARGGKTCGASMSSSASSTSPMRRSLMSSTEPMKSRQKSRNSSRHSTSLLDTRSSCSSSPAVKSYSTYFVKKLRSEEHTSELQSHVKLVCRLLLEKKNNKQSH